MGKNLWKLQNDGDWEMVNRLGSALSLQIDCPVHYPAYGKRMFECAHNCTFPLYMVQGAIDSGDWSIVSSAHRVDRE